MLGKTVSAGRHLIGTSWLTRPAGVGKNASRVDTGVYSCPAGIKSTIRQVFLEICASASCTRVCVCYRTEMPTYVYKCADDGHVFDLIQGFNDKPGAECPTCGSASTRQITVPTVIYKGSGFYTTDYGSGSSSKNGSSSDSKSDSGSDSESGSSSSSKSKSKSKSESSDSSSASKSSGTDSSEGGHSHGGSSHSHGAGSHTH